MGSADVRHSGARQRVRAKRGPVTGSAPSNQTPSFRDAPSGADPESRDSGFDASHRPGMTASGLLRRFVPADFHFGSHEPKARSSSNVCWDDRLLRGCPRTFGPFHRGVVTTDALQVGAAGDGDNSGHSLSTFRAARYLIHETLPNFHP